MRKHKNGIAALFLLVLIIGSLFLVSWVTNYYTRTAMVVKIEGNTITVKENNRLWQFYDSEGQYEEYEMVKMRMSINGTENDSTDDIIIKVNGHRIPEVQGYVGKK